MTVVEARTPTRLEPIERVRALCDPGSVEVLRTQVTSTRLGARARPGDGVVGATGTVRGRQVAVYAEDGSFLGGSLGERHADTIVCVLELAQRARIPVVAFAESGGARIQEGITALAGYGRIFRRSVALAGVVPQISVVSGTSAGGGAYSPALTDVVVMTAEASMFVAGPGVVRDAVGEDSDAHTLGGARIHERNGVCHLVAPDIPAAAASVADLLSYLPTSAGEAPPLAEPRNPAGGDPGAVVPREARQVYDVRDPLRCILDRDSLLELCPRWARNVVTVLARLEGRPVGVLANQPNHIGGVLDAATSEKAARFIRLCDAFGLPLLVFVDTPGFMSGQRQERSGVIRHGASLIRAFAAARVPKFTVVMRKAYGGAYIAMNSRDLGADLALAWPEAELGIMGAWAAVGIVHRQDLKAACDADGERRRLARAYAREHLTAEVAAAAGFVDELVAPADTRQRLAWALGTFGRSRVSV